jgi:hypothetical protein
MLISAHRDEALHLLLPGSLCNTALQDAVDIPVIGRILHSMFTFMDMHLTVDMCLVHERRAQSRSW